MIGKPTKAEEAQRLEAFSKLPPRDEHALKAWEKSHGFYWTAEELNKYRTTPNAINNYRRIAEQKAAWVEENRPRLEQEAKRKPYLSKLAKTMDDLVSQHSEDVDKNFGKRFAARFKNSSIAEINNQISKYSEGPLYEDIRTILSSELPQDRKNLIGKLETSQRVSTTSIAKEAERVLEIQASLEGELDPVDRGRLETQRMYGGGLVSEKPPKLTEDQIAFREQNKLSGSDMRGIAGVQASQDIGFGGTSNQMSNFNKWVNEQVRNLPEAWHTEGSGVADPSNPQRELTKAELWKNKTLLEYGHFGPAASPGYQYMQNWLSNANPESRFYNRLSRDGMTLAEMENAQRMHTANEGFVWTPEHRDATLGRIDDAGLEAPRGGILSLPETTTPLIEDPQRAAINQGIPESKSQLALQEGVGGRSESSRIASGGYGVIPPSELALRQAWERSLPDFDFESQRSMGQIAAQDNLSPEARQRIENLDKGTLEKFRSAVVDQLKNIKAGDFSQMPTATQILDRAAQSLGKGVLGVAPIALMLADPELAEAYDKLSVLKGEELYHEMGKVFGLGDAMTAVNQAVENAYATGKSGVYGPQNAVNSAIGEFGWNTIKAAATEIPGIISSAIQTPVAPAENRSWLEIQQQKAWNNQDPMLNMVPVFQPTDPVKKFGGVVQPMYGDPTLYE